MDRTERLFLPLEVIFSSSFGLALKNRNNNVANEMHQNNTCKWDSYTLLEGMLPKDSQNMDKAALYPRNCSVLESFDN